MVCRSYSQTRKHVCEICVAIVVPKSGHTKQEKWFRNKKQSNMKNIVIVVDAKMRLNEAKIGFQ